MITYIVEELGRNQESRVTHRIIKMDAYRAETLIDGLAGDEPMNYLEPIIKDDDRYMEKSFRGKIYANMTGKEFKISLAFCREWDAERKKDG